MISLVTGGGGFLGSHLVEQLRRGGEPVRVLGRRRYPDLERRGVELLVGDLLDFEAVAAACRGCRTVYHVAGLTGFWGPPRRFFEANVRGTANVLQACLREKVERLVFTSSPSVVYDVEALDIEGGDESLPYPRRYATAYPESKARAEKMVLAANGWEMSVEDPATGDWQVKRLATCALRPHLIWGVGDPHLAPTIIGLARRRRLRLVGDGRNRVSLCQVDNAARAHIQAAAALTQADAPVAGQVYFVNDAQPVLLWEWINRLLTGVGLPPVRRRLAYWQARLLGTAVEGLHRCGLWRDNLPMTRFVAAQMAGSHWFDCGKACRDFGFVPLADPEPDMVRLIEWLRNNNASSPFSDPS